MAEIKDILTRLKNYIDQEDNNEQIRAENAEEALDTKINKEVSDRSAAIEAMLEYVNSVDEELQDNIDAEISRAQGAEDTLQANIDAEETRASNEETRIEGKLDNYIDTNNQALSEEAATRAQADTTLQNNIDAEERRAQGEESRIETKLDNEIQNRENDVDSEETRALAAENTLQDNIDTVQDNLDTEVTRATGVENALRTDLTTESETARTEERSLNARIDSLNLIKQGNTDARVYLKTIKQTDGLIEVELGNFDTSISADGTVSAITAPTTYAVKEYVNAERDRAQAKEAELARLINTEAGYSVVLDKGDREEDYKFRIKLFAKGDSEHPISTTAWLDLPLESVVVDGSYDNITKSLILVLQSGSEITIPVGDLISGLQSEITLNSPLSSDLVDDTNKTHRFVTANEKALITTNANNIGDLQLLKADKSDTYTKATIDGMLDEINEDVEAINTYLDSTPLDVKYESHDGKLGLYKTTRTTTIPTTIVLAATSIADAINALDTKLPTEKAVRTELDKKEDIANRVTSVIGWAATADLSDTKYPTEKLVKLSLDDKEDLANKVSTFQNTPDDIHYPTERLVKENLDEKANLNADNTFNGENTFNGNINLVQGYDLVANGCTGYFDTLYIKNNQTDIDITDLFATKAMLKNVLWDSTETYAEGEIVFYARHLYICIAPNEFSSVTPPDEDTNNWTALFVRNN